MSQQQPSQPPPVRTSDHPQLLPPLAGSPLRWGTFQGAPVIRDEVVGIRQAGCFLHPAICLKLLVPCLAGHRDRHRTRAGAASLPYSREQSLPNAGPHIPETILIYETLPHVSLTRHLNSQSDKAPNPMLPCSGSGGRAGHQARVSEQEGRGQLASGLERSAPVSTLPSTSY